MARPSARVVCTAEASTTLLRKAEPSKLWEASRFRLPPALRSVPVPVTTVRVAELSVADSVALPMEARRDIERAW